jgi:type II restriction enzyme
MLVEDAPASRAVVRCGSPHFSVFPELQGASYLKRYDLFCQRLVSERLYTSAALMTAPRSAATVGAFDCLSEMTSLKTFLAQLAGHIAGEAARRI